MRSTAVEVAAIARRPYWREGDARVVVDAWRQSGESLATFAKRHDIHRHRIARWAGKINGSESRAVQFHPVRVLRGGVSPSIEIQLGDSWRVVVPRDFDVNDLRRVLALLGEKTTC